MKIVLTLLCTVYLAYADEYIKSIVDEVYAVKKFDKYKDLPLPTLCPSTSPSGESKMIKCEPEFVESGEVKFLGWSENNCLAYFISSDGVNMSDYFFGFLVIKDMHNDKTIYVDKFESLKLYELKELYEKYENKIKKTLKKYHIKFQEELFLKKDKRFSMKNIYKKSPYPLGLGNFKKYLESVNIYVDKNGKKKLCSSEIMHEEYWDGKEKRIDYNTLDASLLGVITSPTNKNVTAVAIAYVQTNNAEGNSVDVKILSCNTSDTKIVRINNSTYKSLYSFCKATGIKESEIRKLNPWINKDATNISANAEIVVPIVEKGRR